MTNIAKFDIIMPIMPKLSLEIEMRRGVGNNFLLCAHDFAYCERTDVYSTIFFLLVIIGVSHDTTARALLA